MRHAIVTRSIGVIFTPLTSREEEVWRATLRPLLIYW